MVYGTVLRVRFWSVGVVLCLLAPAGGGVEIEKSTPGNKAAVECIKEAGVPYYPEPRVPGVDIPAIVPERAINACMRATSLDPQSGYLWFLLTRAYLAANDTESARHAAERAIEERFVGSGMLRASLEYGGFEHQ